MALPELPREIITNILSRLPIKSLLQFKTVSKPWLSLISSPHFTKLHLQHLDQNNTRLFMTTSRSFDLQTYSSMEHGLIENLMGSRFVGSCDGLICAVRGRYEDNFVVFNPTTRQLREIPTPNLSNFGARRKHEHCRYGYDYAPNEHCIYGFGYDPKIDDYKIVRGVEIVASTGTFKGFEIFNLKGNSWRTTQTTLWDADEVGFFFGEGTFLNGVLHWPADYFAVIRFDLVQEIFLDKFYFSINDCFHGVALTLLDGCLCMYDVQETWDETFSAWKMMNYGDQNSLTRVYEISVDAIPQICFLKFRFFGVTKNGDLLFEEEKDSVRLCSSVGDATKRIGDGANAYVRKIVYIESLVSPNITYQ